LPQSVQIRGNVLTRVSSSLDEDIFLAGLFSIVVIVP